MNPIVITSKAATEDFNKIKSRHSDILKGMQEQSLRVQQFNADEEARQQADRQLDQTNQMESERMKMDNDIRRMEVENKTKELEIKASALI